MKKIIVYAGVALVALAMLTITAGVAFAEPVKSVEGSILTTEPVPTVEAPEPVKDSDGEPITLERTNQLIQLRDKQATLIKQLREHIAYLDIIITKRDDERKQSELIYLQERRKVELLSKSVKND
jgi:hypothetical protein